MWVICTVSKYTMFFLVSTLHKMMYTIDHLFYCNNVGACTNYNVLFGFCMCTIIFRFTFKTIFNKYFLLHIEGRKSYSRVINNCVNRSLFWTSSLLPLKRVRFHHKVSLSLNVGETSDHLWKRFSFLYVYSQPWAVLYAMSYLLLYFYFVFCIYLILFVFYNNINI